MAAKTCWICGVLIPPREFSKDHVIPRTGSRRTKANAALDLIRFPARGQMRWADKTCNSARGDLSIEVVEDLQTQGLSQAGIRLAMIELARVDRWESRVNREACAL